MGAIFKNYTRFHMDVSGAFFRGGDRVATISINGRCATICGGVGALLFSLSFSSGAGDSLVLDASSVANLRSNSYSSFSRELTLMTHATHKHMIKKILPRTDAQMTRNSTGVAALMSLIRASVAFTQSSRVTGPLIKRIAIVSNSIRVGHGGYGHRWRGREPVPGFEGSQRAVADDTEGSDHGARTGETGYIHRATH